MGHGLSSRRDVRFGEEQPSKPDLDVAEVVQCSNLRELLEAPREVCNPACDGHGFVHLVLAPVGRDRA